MGNVGGWGHCVSIVVRLSHYQGCARSALGSPLAERAGGWVDWHPPPVVHLPCVPRLHASMLPPPSPWRVPPRKRRPRAGSGRPPRPCFRSPRKNPPPRVLKRTLPQLFSMPFCRAWVCIRCTAQRDRGSQCRWAVGTTALAALAPSWIEPRAPADPTARVALLNRAPRGATGTSQATQTVSLRRGHRRAHLSVLPARRSPPPPRRPPPHICAALRPVPSSPALPPPPRFVWWRLPSGVLLPRYVASALVWCGATGEGGVGE